MAVGGIMESSRKSSQLEKGRLTSDWAKLLMLHQHKRKSLFVGVCVINMSLVHPDSSTQPSKKKTKKTYVYTFAYVTILDV